MIEDFSYLIGVDGGLRRIPEYLAEELIAQGWKRVINPKRNYYPEYDRAINKEVIENTVVGEDVLELEKL